MREQQQTKGYARTQNVLIREKILLPAHETQDTRLLLFLMSEERRDALKHRNGFLFPNQHHPLKMEDESNAGNTNTTTPLTTKNKNKNTSKNNKNNNTKGRTLKAWFYRYLQIAFIVFTLTCSIAFAEFIYERLVFEHSEIKEHPRGKQLFVGCVVAVATCWTLLVVVVVFSY